MSVETGSSNYTMQVFYDIDGTRRRFPLDETRIRCADCGFWYPPNHGFLQGCIEFVCESCQMHRWMAEYD